MLNLAADVFEATDGTWTAVITKHPPQGGPGVEVWRKTGMRTAHNADTAMDAAWNRLQAASGDAAAEGE